MPLDEKSYTCADAAVDIEFLAKAKSSSVVGATFSIEAEERRERLMQHMQQPSITELPNVVCGECWTKFRAMVGNAK